jgi:hypothetical protein
VKQASGVLKQLALEGLRQQLDAMVPLVKQVMKQARARIFRGDTRSQAKLLSVFEPSREVIRKGKAAKPNESGKMVKLQEAENQIAIDYEVYARRPNDSDLLIAAIETHQAKLGRTPRLVMRLAEQAKDLWPSGRMPVANVSCSSGYLSGKIRPGDYDKVLTLLNANHPFLGVFNLNSPGGAVDDPLKIGRLFRKHLISTFATSDIGGQQTLLADTRPLCRGRSAPPFT